MTNQTINGVMSAAAGVLFVILLFTTLPDDRLLDAAMSDSAAVAKAISLWGPQADIAKRYNPRQYQVGVKSIGCKDSFTILGQAASSWDAAFISAGPGPILGPFTGKAQFKIPFYDTLSTIASVQLWIDSAVYGTPAIPADTLQPFQASITIDTTMLTTGVHVVCAKATGADGAAGSSQALLFRVMQ